MQRMNTLIDEMNKQKEVLQLKLQQLETQKNELIDKLEKLEKQRYGLSDGHYFQNSLKKCIESIISLIKEANSNTFNNAIEQSYSCNFDLIYTNQQGQNCKYNKISLKILIIFLKL